MEDFGIIIACCEHDYFLAKGCCASIRHFLGDVPICLIVDGTFSTSALEKTYGVRVINHQTVSHKVLKQRSFGWGLTKMIAFWESPWTNFLVLDADTMIWGNILKYANFQDYDAIIDIPRYEHTDAAINKYFFDIQGIETHFPNFNWRAHRASYFCTGTFFAKRNLFSLYEYVEILDFTAAHPEIFKFGGEMGFLNFMLFRAADEARIRLGHQPMQLLVPDFDQKDLRNRFAIAETGSVLQDNNEAVVIHWCGDKPMSFSSKVYVEPMTFSRRKFMRDESNKSGIAAEVVLKMEDCQRYFYMYKNKIRRKLGSIVTPK